MAERAESVVPRAVPGRAQAIALQVLAVAVLTAMGFLLVSQVRAGRQLQQEPEVRTRNLYALAVMLRQEREARRRMEQQIAGLQVRVREYEQAAAEGRTVTESLQRQVEQFRVALGLQALEGPGVVVRVSEPRLQPAGTGPIVVQYQDLVGIANELWAAGAEAVSVNGQRIFATSGFSQVGGTIIVNLQRLSPPYVMLAIGDPATLEGALNIRGGLVEGLRGLGLEIRIERRERVTVPPYRGSIQFEYAKPVERGR
ncbi:MAG: DUF881 domain-containing protein [Armatimonadota bacterium]|nr:DUF881 domain-containing protein [Armatimonadota bacterium]MDR5696874.1 DUF881 domain-containing protein [Armatimonadota bacterium]